ncbi:cation channel sperm-associated protein 3-like [Centroberyx gerrardi]
MTALLNLKLSGRGTAKTELHFNNYIASITESSLFIGLIVLTIILDTVCIALETDYRLKLKFYSFVIVDDIFITIYSMELLMKVYVEPMQYWKNGYNVFDVVLVGSFLPVLSSTGVFSADGSLGFIWELRCVRLLKIVSFFLQFWMGTLFNIMKKVSCIAGQMFAFMFISTLTGYLETPTLEREIQEALDDLGMGWSRIFTIPEKSLALKIRAITQRQREVTRQPMQTCRGNDNFEKLVEQFKKSAVYRGKMVTSKPCTSLAFADLYLATLKRQDYTVNKLNRHNSEMTMVLRELVEEGLLQERRERRETALESEEGGRGSH